MFEEYTEDYLMDQARTLGEGYGVDTRQGSVFMDAATGHCMRTAKFYEDLRTMFDMLAADTCSGEVLDEWAKQKQIYRKAATSSYYNAVFEGLSAADLVGERFMVGSYYFVIVHLETQDTDGYYLESEIPGTETNYLQAGQVLIPVRNMTELTSATLGAMYAAGTDEESDDDLRSRWQAALSTPSENWNAQQFRTTCESYDGVGRAIITALAYGPCTVKALVISSEGTAPPASLIEQMQEEMDPGSEGLGQGLVVLGCKFYAEAAKEESFDYEFNAVLSFGYTLESVEEAVRGKLIEYMKGVALDTPDSEDMVVQYMKVIGILANIEGIKDLAGLTINGVAGNVALDADSVPILGELTINEYSSLSS